MMLASGMFNTFVSVRLELEGFSPETIGIVTSALYFGILAGSWKIDLWITKKGHVKAFISFAIILAILSIFQAAWINPWYWSLLRFVGGICMAGVFIVIESWLLMQSTAAQRGAILSIYLAVFYAATSGGQFLINLSDIESSTPFFITAVLVALSAIPISRAKMNIPQTEAQAPISLGRLYRISPLGFIGGIISGMLLAVVYGLVPVYATEIGMSLPEISTFMAVLIFGGFSLQWPMGRLADSGRRRLVLNIASFVTAVIAIAIAFVTQPILLLFLAWAFGAFSFTIYPLSMAYSCEKLQGHEIVAATGGFVLSYGIGAIAGPIIAPLAMTFIGAEGLFYFLGCITFTLGIIGVFEKKMVGVSTDQ
jgi:MFS family permease